MKLNLLVICLTLTISQFEASPYLRTCVYYKQNISYDSYEQDTDLSNSGIKRFLNDTIVECSEAADSCISAWKTSSDGKVVIVNQGCWINSDNYKNVNSTCIGYQTDAEKENDVSHCYCDSNLCNQNIVILPRPTENPEFITPEKNNQKFLYSTYSYCIFIFILISILIGLIGYIAGQLMKRVYLTNQQKLNQTKNIKEPPYFSNHKNIDNLKLVSIIGEGRFGTVWKGILNEKAVAIKIFNSSKKQNFYNELDIYTKPLLNRCPQLLSYYGYDERVTSDGNKEYMLILSLAEHGSLHKFLKENIISFGMFCQMTLSIARGLSYLHSKIVEKNQTKLTICHRDLNPRNIVVKSDLTCAICDFGYAICVDGPHYQYNGDMILAQTKSISEVGTIRYLAPEMLEGSLNLRDCEIALKQTDVYSLGLVIWELAMRCKDFYKNDEEIPDYRSAYEIELGNCPNFDQMRNLVLQQNARPKFPEDLLNFDANLMTIQDMCQDLWDHDPDARISSNCVEDRLQEMALTLLPESPCTSQPFAGFINEIQKDETNYSSEIELDSTQDIEKDFEIIENMENADENSFSSNFEERTIVGDNNAKSRIFNNIFKKPEACFERLKDVASHIKTPPDMPASVRRTNKKNGKQFTLVKKANDM